MFESVTYEDILRRMLDRVPSDQNKREGAVIYDSTSPAAVELQNAFLSLDGVLLECFPDTASLPFLIQHAKSRGIEHEKAKNAILKAVSTPADIDIPIGSRFSLETLNYVITEKISDGEYKAQCETAGTEGNIHFGALIPIDYVDNELETIQLTDLLIPGEDAEDVEELREKYFRNITSQTFGGNIADYREKVLSMDGVGGVKVTPVWNGGGTVKITITDSTFCVPSNELISTVQNELDPTDKQGQGYGLAPIGHVVTVEGAEGVAVNIISNITYAENWSWDSASSYIQKAVDEHLEELSREWDKTNETALIVRISQLESVILACEGVIDIADTTLNGSEANLVLNKYQVPVRGSINGK